ncbi:hypothetical protein GGR56DRAFT_683504 [Xylariaceae sp. FL0804]|nr:hypothetical protein GGR56DRAFT_683504 [Xylariaceae sp. FL0804]
MVKYRTIVVFLASISQYTIKLAICFFLLAIFRGAQKRARQITYVLMALATVTSLALVLAINAIVNLFYALSPVYVFGTLQLSYKKRATLIALTGSGLIVVAASVVRLALLDEFLDPDVSWATVPVFIADCVERNLAQIISDLPAIYPLLHGVGRRLGLLLSDYAHSGYGTQDQRPDNAYGPYHVVAIGTRKKQSQAKGKVLGPFAAYGRAGRFSNIDEETREEGSLASEISLDEIVPRPPGIMVETTIESKSTPLHEEGG